MSLPTYLKYPISMRWHSPIKYLKAHQTTCFPTKTVYIYSLFTGFWWQHVIMPYGRLFSSVLWLVVCAMDFNGWLLATVSFSGGWFLKGSFQTPTVIESPKSTTCQCDCHFSGYQGLQSPGLSWSIICGIIGVALILLISNFALVCRITLRNSETGQERELQVNVKGVGKSKGLFGAQKGLAITG